MLEYSIGQGYSALDAQAWRDKLDGLAVSSGLGVTAAASGLAVDVASGTSLHGETSGSVDTASLGSTTQVSLSAADSTHPRKDTIHVDNTGTPQVATGTAEAANPDGNARFETYEPEPPFPPNSDDVILAEVWVAAGATSLSSSDIRDRRAPADNVADRLVSQSVSTEELAYGEADLDTASITEISINASETKTIEVSEIPNPILGLLTVRVGSDGGFRQTVATFNAALHDADNQSATKLGEDDSRETINVDSVQLNSSDNLTVTISESSGSDRSGYSLTLSTNSIIERTV